MPTYHSKISSKLPLVPTSIFAVMSKLCHEEQALNLAQGYPDFPSSPELISLVNQAMKEGHNQYAPMPGVYALREVIGQKIETLYGSRYNPDTEITVTAGATQAIFTIITALIAKNDEVIIFAPAYDCYDPAIRLNGGITVEIALKRPDFKIDWEEVKASISQKTKMIIINTPHNPTGTVLKREDMQKLEALVHNTNIVVLSDEVYEHLIYDGLEHQSIARFPALAQQSFLVASFGKTFHSTGWKMGYCAGPARLMEEFRKVHQFNVFSVNHPVQKALSIYLQKEEHYLYLPDFFQAKRDLFLDAIKDSKFLVRPSSGTYFQLLDYGSITEENDMELAKRLTREKKLASIPVSSFYMERTDHKILRFCFAKSDETLLKGAEIINNIA